MVFPATGPATRLGDDEHGSGGHVVALPGSRRALTDCSAGLCLWSIEDGLRLAWAQSGHSDTVESLAVDPKGRWAAAGGENGTARLFRLPRLRAGKVLAHGSVDSAVSALAFAPNGKRLATAGGEGVIKVWAVPSGRLRRTVDGDGHRVRSMAWSAGHGLAVASARGVVRLVRFSHNAAEERVLTGHLAGVVGVAFAPGDRLVSVSRDSTALVWSPGSDRRVPH